MQPKYKNSGELVAAYNMPARLGKLYAEFVKDFTEASVDPRAMGLFLVYDGKPFCACIHESQAADMAAHIGKPDSMRKAIVEDGKVTHLSDEVDELEIDEACGLERDPHEKGN